MLIFNKNRQRNRRREGDWSNLSSATRRVIGRLPCTLRITGPASDSFPVASVSRGSVACIANVPIRGKQNAAAGEEEGEDGS